MRRPVLLALGLVLTAPLALGAAPAFAHPGIPLDPTLPTDVTFAATDNVSYLGRFPEHFGTAGGYASKDGKTFYVTDPRGVFTYDTTDASNPVLQDSLLVFQQQTGVALAQEDPDTNGEILLVDGATTAVAASSSLHVVDVSDPTDLKVLATVPVTDHTWTCVTAGDNGCAYAYGRTGHIVDLRVPAEPKLLTETWRKAVSFGDRGNSPYTHDLTEIRPGLVMSAGSTNVLMDTRNPVKPLLLNKMDQSSRFPSLGYHSVEWARDGADRWLVAGTEIAPSGTFNTAGSDCKGEESVIETWDTTAVRTALDAYYAGTGSRSAVNAARFTKVDDYSVSGRGIFLDGAAPGHVLYCAHWMEQHPTFSDSGLLTVSYYDRGTRFVQVGEDGMMTEKGWIVAAEGYSGSSQWVRDDIVYISDYRRGLEIVQLDDAAARGVLDDGEDVIALASTVLLAAEQRQQVLPLAGGLLLALLVVNVAVLRRRRVG